jgi:hypothetical protein
MRGRTIFLALLWLLSAAARAGAASAPADDCAVIAQAGKERLGWSASPPGFEIALRAGDSAAYFASCRWAAYGLGSPKFGSLKSEILSIVDPPAYWEDAASLDLILRRTTHGIFAVSYNCALAKRGSRWSVVECHVTGIS